jgi:hypothetical protein
MDILPFGDGNNHGIGGNQNELKSRVSRRIRGHGALNEPPLALFHNSTA